MVRMVFAERAPQALGPYSHAVVVGDFVFVSGQLGIDPKTGELVPGGIAAESRQALVNLASILETAETAIDCVVKTTVFLKDLSEFAFFNQVYAEFFGDHRPARAAVQVAALPAGARVEIEAVASRLPGQVSGSR